MSEFTRLRQENIAEIPSKCTNFQAFLAVKQGLVSNAEGLNGLRVWIDKCEDSHLLQEFDDTLTWPLVAMSGSHIHQAWHKESNATSPDGNI